MKNNKEGYSSYNKMIADLETILNKLSNLKEHVRFSKKVKESFF